MDDVERHVERMRLDGSAALVLFFVSGHRPAPVT